MVRAITALLSEEGGCGLVWHLADITPAGESFRQLGRDWRSRVRDRMQTFRGLLPPCLPALHVCLSTCLPACLPALPACLPALPACLPALPACLPALPACLPALPACLPSRCRCLGDEILRVVNPLLFLP